MILTENDKLRFWSRITKSDVPNECWLWDDQKVKYGSIKIGKTSIFAHRLSWLLLVGPIPAGIWVLHKCDTPGCCNPEHLFLGTQFDNMRDCASKGRHGSQLHPERLPRGELQHKAKLNREQVLAIRNRYASGGITYMELAREYNVGKATIGNILNYHSWAWL